MLRPDRSARDARPGHGQQRTRREPITLRLLLGFVIGVLALPGCGSGTTSTVDASTRMDAGASDASGDDGSASDTGATGDAAPATDAGGSDASARDAASTEDASASDSGTDA